MVQQHKKLTFPNFNYKEMRKVCSDKENILAKRYGLTHYQTLHGDCWFKDNGSDLLAVAHLDSQCPFTHFTVNKIRPDTHIWCPTLDDRLGAYIILEWLQLAGCRYDILLTTNEEKSQSTAIDFEPPQGKQYNWMFSFDRTGADVVTYQYRDPSLVAKLEEHGWVHKYGSYSCIADLEDLGCKGMNFGVGYYNYHSPYAYASRNDLTRNLRRFLSFYMMYHAIALPHKAAYHYTAPYNRNQKHFNFDHSQYAKSVKKESSKVETIRERKKKEKRDKKEAARLKNMQINFLLQNTSVLNIDNDLTSVLEREGLFTVADLVSKNPLELIEIEDINWDEIEELKKAIKGFQLQLGTDLKKEFNMEVMTRDITDAEIEAADKEAEVAVASVPLKGQREQEVPPLVPIPLTQPVKLKAQKSAQKDPLPLTKEALKGVIIYPKADKHKRELTVQTARRFVARGQKVKVQDVCVKCGHNYQIALHDEKEVLKLERGETCPSCNESGNKENSPTLTRCLLIQNVEDRLVFRRLSDGSYGWTEVAIVDGEKKPAWAGLLSAVDKVGFTAPAKK